MKQEYSTLSSLSRYRLTDEYLVSDNIIRDEISRAFQENRCFDFVPDPSLVSLFNDEKADENIIPDFIRLRNDIYKKIAGDNNNLYNSFLNDARLSSRLLSGLFFIHKTIANKDYHNLHSRRFVLIKERSGFPTIYHLSEETTVISHVGTGPEWGEIPSIYLGLNIFHVLTEEQKNNKTSLFEAFKILLMIEARAIETGYAHTEIFSPSVSGKINNLVNALLEIHFQEKVEFVEEKKPPKLVKYSQFRREKSLSMLDARNPGDILNFDYQKNLKEIEALERLSRRYKKTGDNESLEKIVRVLVPASGHDIHEIRNRANILLERIFSPKEFDSPLASRFINAVIGSEVTIEFKLDQKSDYFLRIYRKKEISIFTDENNIETADHNIKFDDRKKTHYVKIKFNKYGHFDFLVYKQKKINSEWINLYGTSGRINIIPDIKGEIILEIFPDIHGHTRTFWKDGSGHPGLVYNENGEIIRLGTFADITAHLEYIKEKYYITSIYLLGVQERGRNKDDWAPGASSPSPFSPMSLTQIEPTLGGSEELSKLISRAHSLNIRIIVDIVPHLNRGSGFPAEQIVKCYNNEGRLVERASTDGRFGSWDDGRLHNYRMFEVWEWIAGSITELIDKFDIDGIRFDSAHAVPIMMKKNNFPLINKIKRSHKEMLEGTIIVNDREDSHFITTGYYDSACRESIAVPFHYYIMLKIESKLREKNKDYFINIAECYWGHEKYLARTGIIPYNSALFKICENIIHGQTDVREIYHIYDNYFPGVLPQGTELLGILGNHDERRALNTFGHRGLRAAVALTMFMSNIIMDYEGGAEGEGWKIFLDNVYVNWNLFENAAHRSVEDFYREWYKFHRENKSKGYLIWANNNMVAAAMLFFKEHVWIGIFNFSEANQPVSLQFDNPVLPIPDNVFYKVVDPMYSQITGGHGYFTGEELKISRINSFVSYTERVKLLKLEKINTPDKYYTEFLRDSFNRLCYLSAAGQFISNFAFKEIIKNLNSYKAFKKYLTDIIKPAVNENDIIQLGIKRSLFHACLNKKIGKNTVLEFIENLCMDRDDTIAIIGEYIKKYNQSGPIVFLSAEAEPFSKSGGLANVIYELPRELVKQGETVYVITGLYRNGDDKSVARMNEAIQKYNVTYTGINASFRILDTEYTVGIHSGTVDGVTYFLLEHHEFFDGLYWGITSNEKLRRRIAFARASIELIIKFNLNPHFTFTNDAYTGLFNGILRCDPYYTNNANFIMNKFMHVIHNGGWQYFDAYHFYEKGFNLFELFNLPSGKAHGFADPVHADRLNCMAAGIKFADKVITVSPSYAMQIERACDGLEHILNNVLGISNAIGSDFKKRIFRTFKSSHFIDEYYPKLIDHIKKNKDLNEKIKKRYPEILKDIDKTKDKERKNILKRISGKMMMQLQRGFKVDPDIALLCMIHRISEQKGFQLLLDASEGIFKKLKCQIILGGAVSSGDRAGEEIAHGLYQLSRYYPDQISLSFGFQDVSIPLLSSDFFCMPSMNEPGGISQLEALSCGCLVIARATGGLRDTVFPVRVNGDSVKGNGFLFTDFSAWAFYDAIERASSFLANDDRVIYKARKIAENSVSFWDKSAIQYIKEIYKFREVIR
ncbi:MAG: glycogen/starch synthase [Spirochaetes bacterium]|nr:glycogen/starch synthase [Spirochaetota bacterium]